MRPLAWLQHIPNTAIGANLLDRHRSERVAGVVSAHPTEVGSARAACSTLLERPADPAARASLAKCAERLLAALRAPSEDDGPLMRGLMQGDAIVRSNGLELLDRERFPRRIKDFTMRTLHHTNVVAGSYDRWVEAVTGAVDHQPGAHVYDLAAGTGGFARHLASVPGHGLRISSSDRAAEYVGMGMQAAEQAGLETVAWEVCDALDLRALRDRRDVDLFLCTQAAHHFDPGPLVQMISQAVASAPRGILIIDLLRAGTTALGTAAVAALAAAWPVLMYDGFQSVRRAYTLAEFKLLALLAGAQSVDARACGPAWCLVHARQA